MGNLILKGLTGKIARFASWFAGSRRGPVAELEDLPLVVYPPRIENANTKRFVVLYSGDGGWANLTSHLATALQDADIPVVGVDCMRYFWGGKTAERTGRDLERIIGHFSRAWQREDVALIGYSMGADVLPGSINCLDTEQRKPIRHITLIGLSQAVDYKFRFSSWLGYVPSEKNGGEPLLPLIEKLFPLPVFSVCGEKEHDSLTMNLEPNVSETLILPGGHHFGGDYTQLTSAILSRLS